MTTLHVHITGIMPLVMENPRLSDPEDEFTQQINSIVKKRERTADDRAEKEHLQFLGSLYVSGDGPFVPNQNLHKCWIEGGKARKLGAAVERSVLIPTVEMQVQYDGPRDPEELWKDKSHHFRSMVNPNPSSAKKGRVPRMRPMFQEWQLDAEVQLLTQFMDRSDFEEVVASSGVMMGLCGARRIGFGRYTAVVK